MCSICEVNGFKNFAMIYSDVATEKVCTTLNLSDVLTKCLIAAVGTELLMAMGADMCGI